MRNKAFLANFLFSRNTGSKGDEGQGGVLEHCDIFVSSSS